MQQSASDQLPLFAGNVELLTDGDAVPGHIHAVMVHCHISMLDKGLGTVKIP